MELGDPTWSRNERFLGESDVGTESRKIKGVHGRKGEGDGIPDPQGVAPSRAESELSDRDRRPEGGRGLMGQDFASCWRGLVCLLTFDPNRNRKAQKVSK